MAFQYQVTETVALNAGGRRTQRKASFERGMVINVNCWIRGSDEI